MPNSYLEHHPLLCDEVYDEELRPPHFNTHRRHRAIGYRAGNDLKGAAVLIRRWPEYWSSSVIYWWVGLGMITLTFFVIYNGVLAFAMLPQANPKPMRQKIQEAITENKVNAITTLPDIFMHLFVNDNKRVNIEKYLPHIETLGNKFSGFRYNIIVIYNDTNIGLNYFDDPEEINEIAINKLWNKNNVYEKLNINIQNYRIQYLTLSKYMNDSPLRKHWRHLPHQFIELLARAISIWDKGGVAFNPVLLTPQSPHPIYLEKIEQILQNYNTPLIDDKSDYSDVNTQDRKDSIKPKKRLNNIRDIIDALENEDVYKYDNYFHQNLTEAETKIKRSKTGRKLLSTTSTETDKIDSVAESKCILSNDVIEYPSSTTNYGNNKTRPISKNYFIKESKTNKKLQSSTANNSSNMKNVEQDGNTVNKDLKFGSLPSFLEYLFHENPVKSKTLSALNTSLPEVKRVPKSTFSESEIDKETDLTSAAENNEVALENTENSKPIMIMTNGTSYQIIGKKTTNNKIIKESYNVEKLTIDLKGNIIATKTACHAFIGSIFTNAIHHSEDETLSDFIIQELSLFCKGLLSTCKSIDIILL